MTQFIHDMVRMTEGGKLINYWWLWLTIMVVGTAILYFTKERF